MALIYKCKNCGYILYDSRHMEKYMGTCFGIPTPSEVALWYGGKCPRCGRELNTKPNLKDVVVSITRSATLKGNPSARAENGGGNEAHNAWGNRLGARDSASSSEGQNWETISSVGDEDLGSDKKRA